MPVILVLAVGRKTLVKVSAIFNVVNTSMIEAFRTKRHLNAKRFMED